MATFAQSIELGPFLVSGTPDNGPKLYHYAAGTTNLLDIFSDRAKSTPLAQPFVGDSKGVFQFYGDGIYKLQVQDHNANVLYTWDNVNIAEPPLLGKGAALASASTVTLGTDGSYFHVTGTVTITALSGTQSFVILTFDSALTLTYNATNLILLNATSRTTASGEAAMFVNEGSGNWREVGKSSPLGSNNIWTGTNQFNTTLLGPGFKAQDFRLTLTTATPVTTSDVTAAGTLYCTPYTGDRIALYDGAVWNQYTSAEMSVAVPAATSTVHDVFCFANAGVPTLEILAWTNDTTRATALVYQNGVLSKTGALTRRYLGTFRTTTVANQTEDSVAKRYLWNYYNRVGRKMMVIEGTATWNYTLATFRQANGAAANQLDFVVGVAEDMVQAKVMSSARNTSGNTQAAVGIGYDSTTVNSADVKSPYTCGAANVLTPITAETIYIPTVGRHFLTWLEYSEATGTTTWFGNNSAATIVQSGILGYIRN